MHLGYKLAARESDNYRIDGVFSDAALTVDSLAHSCF